MFGWFEKIGAERGLNWSETGLLLFAAAVAAGLIGEYLKDREDRWKGLSDAFEMLVIIGVVGEVVFDGLIFGFSGRLDALRDISVSQANTIASEAYKVGNKAHENAITLAIELAVLQGKNEQFEYDNQLRQKEVDANQAALEKDLKKNNFSVQGFESRERPQDVDDDDVRRATRGLSRRLRVVTLIRLKDPIAGPYADKIARALENQKPKFTVYSEPLASSEFRGVIVCENGEGDRKVGRALKNAGIVSEIKNITAKECERNLPSAGPPSLTLGLSIPLGPGLPPRHGTVIFVGHRRLPPQN